MKGVRILKFLIYDKVREYVNYIWNVVIVYDLLELYEDLDESQQVNGVYRELIDILFELVDFFISIDEIFGEKLYILYFSDDKYYFYVVCGVDGVLFGKDDEVIVWLIFFFNSGSYIISEKENFLLVGVNCFENYIVM